MRRLLAIALACLAGLAYLAPAAVLAQVSSPLVQDSKPLEGRRNQKVERIRIEDESVRIDETRYAGQTENITVQPKGGMPAYEVLPASPARARLDDGRRPGGPGGDRVWNVLSF